MFPICPYSDGSGPFKRFAVKSSVERAWWREKEAGSVPVQCTTSLCSSNMVAGVPRQCIGCKCRGWCSRNPGSCYALVPTKSSVLLSRPHQYTIHLSSSTHISSMDPCIQQAHAGQARVLAARPSPSMALNLKYNSKRLGKPVPQLMGSVPRRLHLHNRSFCSLVIRLQLSGSVPGNRVLLHECEQNEQAIAGLPLVAAGRARCMRCRLLHCRVMCIRNCPSHLKWHRLACQPATIG